jgi:hypothetical protein
MSLRKIAQYVVSSHFGRNQYITFYMEQEAQIYAVSVIFKTLPKAKKCFMGEI